MWAEGSLSGSSGTTTLGLLCPLRQPLATRGCRALETQPVLLGDLRILLILINLSLISSSHLSGVTVLPRGFGRRAHGYVMFANFSASPFYLCRRAVPTGHRLPSRGVRA